MGFLLCITSLALVWSLRITARCNTKVARLKAYMKEREVTILCHCQNFASLSTDFTELRYWKELQALAHPYPLFEIVPMEELRRLYERDNHSFLLSAKELVHEHQKPADFLKSIDSF